MTLKANEYREIIWLRDALSIDPYESSVAEINKSVQKLNKTKREDILAICEKVLNNKRIGRRENDMIRVAAIKVIVAAAPHSAHVIQHLVTNTSDRNAYEIHFTLFCCLDQLRKIPDARELCPVVLSYVKDYLQRVKYDTARAA